LSLQAVAAQPSAPAQTAGDEPFDTPHRSPARYLWAMLLSHILVLAGFMIKAENLDYFSSLPEMLRDVDLIRTGLNIAHTAKCCGSDPLGRKLAGLPDTHFNDLSLRSICFEPAYPLADKIEFKLVLASSRRGNPKLKLHPLIRADILV